MVKKSNHIVKSTVVVAATLASLASAGLTVQTAIAQENNTDNSPTINKTGDNTAPITQEDINKAKEELQLAEQQVKTAERHLADLKADKGEQILKTKKVFAKHHLADLEQERNAAERRMKDALQLVNNLKNKIKENDEAVKKVQQELNGKSELKEQVEKATLDLSSNLGKKMQEAIDNASVSNANNESFQKFSDETSKVYNNVRSAVNVNSFKTLTSAGYQGLMQSDSEYFNSYVNEQTNLVNTHVNELDKRLNDAKQLFEQTQKEASLNAERSNKLEHEQAGLQTKLNDYEKKLAEAKETLRKIEAEPETSSAQAHSINGNVTELFDFMSKSKSLTQAQRTAAAQANDILLGRNSKGISRNGAAKPSWYDSEVKLGQGVKYADFLQNVKASISYMRALNNYRVHRGLQPLQVNLKMIATATIDTFFSSHRFEHAKFYNAYENIAWDNVNSTQDYNGGSDSEANMTGYMKAWITEEKVIYDQFRAQGLTDAQIKQDYNKYEQVGHYLNFIEPNIKGQGFALGNNGDIEGYYDGIGIWNADFSYDMTVDEFEKAFNEYINGSSNANDHKTKVENARKAVNDVETEYNTTKKALDDFNTAHNDLAAVKSKANDDKAQVEYLNDAISRDEMLLKDVKKFAEDAKVSYSEDKAELAKDEDKAKTLLNELEKELEKKTNNLDELEASFKNLEKDAEKFNNNTEILNILKQSEKALSDIKTLAYGKKSVNLIVQSSLVQRNQETLKKAETTAENYYQLMLKQYNTVNNDYESVKNVTDNMTVADLIKQAEAKLTDARKTRDLAKNRLANLVARFNAANPPKHLNNNNNAKNDKNETQQTGLTDNNSNNIINLADTSLQNKHGSELGKTGVSAIPFMLATIALSAVGVGIRKKARHAR